MTEPKKTETRLDRIAREHDDQQSYTTNWNEVDWLVGRLRELTQASKHICDSIKWSGDINQANLAPKIMELRAILMSLREEKP